MLFIFFGDSRMKLINLMSVLFSVSFLFASATAVAQVPAGWVCDPSYYDDGVCDCGCEVKDMDCPASGSFEICERSGCTLGQVPWEHQPESCMQSACGDGWRDENLGEVCDDGDGLNRGGCNADCSAVNLTWTCGVRAEGCQRQLPDAGFVFDSGVFVDASPTYPDAVVSPPDTGSAEIVDTGVLPADTGSLLPDAGATIPDTGLNAMDAEVCVADTGAEVVDAGIPVDSGPNISEPMDSGSMTSEPEPAPRPTPEESDTSGCNSVPASDISLWFLFAGVLFGVFRRRTTNASTTGPKP
ncbi:MAG: hypothetical protein VYC39_13950 [Myxococcota bacterium]|nr:hypothetical protein [Myxococcota bacterium]